MTPEQIKEVLASECKELHPVPLPTEGKGYSFWLGVPNASNTNRIIRASKDSPSAPTQLKLAVNDRLSSAQQRTARSEFPFTGDIAKLLEEVDQEIAAYKKYIEPRLK